MSEKNSPLPWAATTREGSWDWVVFQKDRPHLEVCQMFHDGTEDNEEGEANAELIVRAVNERDGLLAEIERLREQLASAREALRKIAEEDYKAVDEQVRWNRPMMIWQSVARSALDALTDDLRSEK